MYGPTGDKLTAIVRETLGVEILSLGASGFRIFLSKKPIHKADDVRGITNVWILERRISRSW